MTKQYQITCTEKQLQIIAHACELYGDVQNGNPLSIADHLPLAQRTDRFVVRQSLTALFKQHQMQACSDNANDAIAIWRKITRNNDFTHGTEPPITIKELENTHDNQR